MADNKLLLKRGSEEEFISEDDPLAELARLVGYEPVSSARSSEAAHRREPAFDLEDELLKELDIYTHSTTADNTNSQVYAAGELPDARDSYRAPDVAIEPEPAFEPEPAYSSEPTFAPEPELAAVAEFEPEPVAAVQPVEHPVRLEAVETVSDLSGNHVYERPASHPVFDLEDEILREFSAFDARRVNDAGEHPVAAEVVHQTPPVVETQSHDLSSGYDARTAVEQSEQGRSIYASFRDDDLEQAISNAFVSDLDVSEPEPVIEAPVYGEAPSVVAEQSDYVESQHLDAPGEAAPVAYRDEPVSFDAKDADAIEQPVEAQAAQVADDVVDYSSLDDELVRQDFADNIPAAPSDASEAIAVIRRGAAQQSATVEQGSHDELLDDVERYPVGDNTARWGVHSMPAAAAGLVGAAPSVVHDYAAERPLAATDHSAFDRVEPAFVSDVGQSAPAYSENSLDDIDDSNFDIDIGDIEFDLSDLHEPEVPVSQPVLPEPVAAPLMAYSVPAPAVVAGVVDNDYSTLPFDPTQITLEDETFETIADMDVPDAPVVHEEEKPTPHPEYDIDLDAEMAQLFVTATTQASPSQRGAQAADSAEASPARAQSAGLDLDDFERALEEDFRRSFAENRAGSAPDRVPLAPLSEQEKPGKSARRWLLPATAAAIVLFGGAGVYAFVTGDAKMLDSSEPKIILADTDPVKVVPDDPGGQKVPNQNKAVYDRVAGEKADGAKQQNLVTSNEEPVDVVQRTLMPENIQFGNDPMAVSTPTGDTIDPRLLPDEEEQDRVTTTNKVVSGVSPRKVKTMVVRPDGSLVEREVSGDDVAQQEKNDAELTKIAQKAAQDAATASASQADEIAKAIDSVPERLGAETTGRIAAPAADPVVSNDDAVASKTDLKPATDPAQVDFTGNEPASQPLERSLAVDDSEALAAIADAETPAEVASAEEADAPVRKVRTTTIAPVPDTRPVEATAKAQTDEEATRVASLDDAAPKLAETPVVPAGSYVIQIASLPSEAEAQTSYNRLSAKFAGIIGGKGVDIRRAEIKNKGVYYRVRIPAGSKQEAQALCTEYKSAGGSCLVSK
jgi:hypothetical protein